MGWLGIALLILDLGTSVLNILLHNRTYKKGAERAKRLIVGHPKFKLTWKRMKSLEVGFLDLKNRLSALSTVNERIEKLDLFIRESLEKPVNVTGLNIPTADEIAYKIATHPEVQEKIKESLQGQVSKAIDDYEAKHGGLTGAAPVQDPEALQNEYNRWFNTLRFLGDEIADSVAYGIINAPPLIKIEMIKKATKMIKNYGG